MSIYPVVDAASDALVEQMLELLPTLATQGEVTEADALYHMRRTLIDKLKKARLHDGVDLDDGRAATWRVRVQIWTGPEWDTCLGDSDPHKHTDDEGDTVIRSLTGVGDWVRELAQGAHAPATIEGLGDGDIARKIKSLRVALHHQHGSCAWRLRYTVIPPASEDLSPEEARERGLNSLKYVRRGTSKVMECLAQVRISRESVAPRAKRS